MSKQLLLFLLCLSNLGTAQDLKADLAAMAKHVSEQALLGWDISVSIYRTKEKKDPPMVQTLRLYKKGTDYYYHTQEAEMFLSSHSLIMVQPNTKSLVYRAITSKEYKEMAKSMGASASDTLLTQYDSLAYRGIEKEGKHYSIYSSKRAIQRTEIYLHPSSMMIQKVIYHYNTQLFKDFNRVDVRFETRNPSPEEQEKYLKESAYVAKKDKKNMVPSSRFAGYQVEVVEND